MWFSGFILQILPLTVEVYLRWKLQITPFFVSGKHWKIGSVSNTHLPHCVYIYIYIIIKLWSCLYIVWWMNLLHHMYVNFVVYDECAEFRQRRHALNKTFNWWLIWTLLIGHCIHKIYGIVCIMCKAVKTSNKYDATFIFNWLFQTDGRRSEKLWMTKAHPRDHMNDR